jgi:hypothetical protein
MCTGSSERMTVGTCGKIKRKSILSRIVKIIK